MVKLRQRLRKLTGEASEAYQNVAGEPVATTLNRLQHEPLEAMANWIKGKPDIGPILDWQPESGRPIPLPISEHPDKVVAVTTGTEPQRARGFPQFFSQFIHDNVNKVAALQAVVQRPRELTRADLKAFRIELDRQGFSESALRTLGNRRRTRILLRPLLASFVRPRWATRCTVGRPCKDGDGPHQQTRSLERATAQMA